MNDVVSKETDKVGQPPPSPLTGCYLLIVIGEPHNEQHKDIILQRVAKGRFHLINLFYCNLMLSHGNWGKCDR